MRRAALRPRLALALLAWFAQLCLPVLHAAAMAAPPAPGLHAWCGDPSRALAAMAEWPPEMRAALLPDDADADPLAACALLCATAASAPPLPSTPSVTEGLRIAGLEDVPPAATPLPRARAQSPTPPAQGPPRRG